MFNVPINIYNIAEWWILDKLISDISNFIELRLVWWAGELMHDHVVYLCVE